MSNNLCFIKTKNSLKQKEKRHKIISLIKDKILSIHDYVTLRQNNTFDPELILLVCNCVENTVKKHAGVDKKELVVDILNDIFLGLTNQEKDNIRNQCQYNFDNNLIELIPLTRKIGSILYNYIKSKF